MCWIGENPIHITGEPCWLVNPCPLHSTNLCRWLSTIPALLIPPPAIVTFACSNGHAGRPAGADAAVNPLLCLCILQRSDHNQCKPGLCFGLAALHPACTHAAPLLSCCCCFHSKLDGKISSFCRLGAHIGVRCAPRLSVPVPLPSVSAADACLHGSPCASPVLQSPRGGSDAGAVGHWAPDRRGSRLRHWAGHAAT